MNITVLGAGTWGTALTILLASNGHNVTLWSAVQKEIEGLMADRSAIRNLPGAVLPDSVRLVSDIEEAISMKPQIIVFAVASIFVRSTAARLKGLLPEGQIIVNVAKGIEENTLFTLCDVIKDELPEAQVCVLSGPTHAEEVSLKMPTTIVIGAEKEDTAKLIQDTFMNEFFRVYTSPDVLGIELGGSLKNVIALAAGIADGMGFGDNAKAALMTRGIVEISRLGIKMGGKAESFNGLSGIGDLIVTCTSKHSRNRNAGFLMGQGKSCDEALKEVGQVVEGVYCAKAAKKLADKYEVEMPIVEQINLILFENKNARLAVKDLFSRDKRIEHYGLSWEE